MEKVLTVSIAAYNIEPFITETLNSFIIHEIMDKLEVIVVNDGSKDRTSEIAHQYERKYPGVFVVIDKPNGGYGSTINASSRAAKGKYYKTVDGDDWVDKEGFIRLINYLSGCDDDLVVTNYMRVNDVSKKMIPTEFSCSEYCKSFLFDEEYAGQELFMQALAIKTSILKELELSITEHCFYTDIEYILTPIPKVNTISFLDEFVYMYRIAVNEQSMSVAGKRKHIDEQLTVLKKMTYFYEKKKRDLGTGKSRFFITILSEMYKSHVTAILSLKIAPESKARLLELESFMKNTAPDIYENTLHYRTIKALRITNYYVYVPGSIAYKAYQQLLGLIGR